MNKPHEANSSNKARKATMETIEKFIGEIYLPTAIRFLVSRWGQELSELILEYDNLSERILVWRIDSGYDFCSFPEYLTFSLKTDFIEKFQGVLGRLDRETTNAIYSPCDGNLIKIVTFTPILQNNEMHNLLSIGAVDIPRSKPDLVFLANHN